MHQSKVKVCCGCRCSQSFVCRKGLYSSLLRSQSGHERARWQAPVFQKATKYIGVHLDRTLNFKQPMKKLRRRLHNITLGVINASLTVTTWGGCAITLRNSTQALVFSSAWIRVTVWNRTPNVKVDVNINSAILTISGCLNQLMSFSS